MRLSRLWLIAAFVAPTLVSSVRGDPIDSTFSPKRERSKAQQERDDADCRRWATLHTDFDPKRTTPSAAPRRETRPAPDPIPGAGGRVFRDMAGDEMRKRERMDRRRREEQEAADFENQRASYDRAVKTCIEGRNHSAKSPSKE